MQRPQDPGRPSLFIPQPHQPPIQVAVGKRAAESCTKLRPNQLGQGPDELRRSIQAQLQGFFVDDLTDGEPESGFETLGQKVSRGIRVQAVSIFA